MGCKKHKETTVTSKSFFLPEELERRILKGYYRGIGPRSSLSIYIMGLRPKPRTRGRPRRVNTVKGAHISKKKLVLIITAQEIGPRMNASSANQGQDL